MARYSDATAGHEFFRIPDRVFWTYNAHDVRATAELTSLLQRELQESHQLDYWEGSYWPTVEAVLALQARGLGIDRLALRRYKAAVTKELAETDTIIRDAAGDPNLNINSRPQVGKLLYEKLGLKVPRLTDGGQPSVDQHALVTVLRGLRQRDQHAKPILTALFHRSKLNTILTRYLIVEPDPSGRVYPRIKLYGAETGRLAYADPPLQQWPPAARHVFVPRPGYVFVGCDYSQIEARLLAILANDEVSLRVFREGGDVHRQNAMDLFGLTDTQWSQLTPTQVKAYRNYAKTFLYGISYGGNPTTIHTKLFCPCPKCEADQPPTLNLGPTEIKRAADRWFWLHRAVPEWHRQLMQQVSRTHRYTSPLGRRRVFCEPWPTCERSAKNVPMQMTAALIMDRAMVRLHQAGAPLVLQMHDQFVVECPQPEADYWVRKLVSCMESPVPELGDTVFPAEPEVGDTWGTLKAVPHPNR